MAVISDMMNTNDYIRIQAVTFLYIVYCEKYEWIRLHRSRVIQVIIVFAQLCENIIELYRSRRYLPNGTYSNHETESNLY